MEKNVCKKYIDYPDVLTISEVADILKIGRNNTYKLINSGKIRSIHIGRLHRISKKSLIEYIENSNQ